MNLSLKRLVFYSIFVINLGVIVSLWWQGSHLLLSYQAGQFIALGRLAGLLAELCILVQLLMIGRITVIEQEYGFDKLNQFHRTFGLITLGFIIIHPLLLLTGYSLDNQVNAWAQFVTFFTTWQDVWKAMVGLIIFCIAVGISINVVRNRLKYETWYFSHLSIYVAIILVFGHQTNTGDMSHGGAFYYWYILNFVVFGGLLLYRFMRPLYYFARHRFYIEKIVQETPTVYSIYINGRAMNSFVYQAGQYAHLFFIARGRWSAHPFSFSIAPNGQYLRFSIKQSGDFTDRINELKPGTPVIIDGPLGVFTERKALRNKYALIAGGIGVTPIRALAESLQKQHRDVQVLHIARDQSELAFASEFTSLTIPYHTGIGRATLETIHEAIPDIIGREVYVCGPEPMIMATLDMLVALGIPARHIHYERFGY